MGGTAEAVAGWSPKDFLAKVVEPAIAALPLDEADQGETVPVLRLLLLGTALQESLLRHVDQLPNRDGLRGPALGYFQMEPATHDDIWANYLAFRPALAAQVRAVAGIAAGRPEAKLLRTNHVYAAVMARVLYRRVKGRLPQVADVKTLAAYWKAHYNTALGKGKAAEFEEKLAAVLARL